MDDRIQRLKDRWRESVLLRDIALLYAEVAFIGVLNGTIGVYLGVFAIRLGASNNLIGLLSSIPALINVLLMYPASKIVNSWLNKIEINKWSFLFTRILYLPLAFIPYFPNPSFFILIIVTLLAIPASVANIAFNVMFIELVPSSLRATVVSNRNMLVMFIQTFSTIVVGYLLDRIIFPRNFQLVMFIGFLSSMISLYLMTLLKPTGRSAPSEGREPVELSSIWTQFRDIYILFKKDRMFMMYQIATFIYYLGLYVPMPLFSIRMVRELHFSNFEVGLTNTSGGLATAISYPYWGRKGKKLGIKRSLFWCNMGISFYPLIFSLLRGSSQIVPFSAVGGFFSAGFSVFIYMALLLFLSQEKKAEYLAVNGIITSISLTIGPILGTQLSRAIGTTPVFFIGTIIRLIGTYLLLKTIPD